MKPILKDIVTILNTIPGLKISPTSPKTFTATPTVVYTLVNNDPTVDLEYNLMDQRVTIKLDIWTDTPLSGETQVSLIEATMRADGYITKNINRVPNIDPSLTHNVMYITKTIV